MRNAIGVFFLCVKEYEKMEKENENHGTGENKLGEAKKAKIIQSE